MTTWACPLLPPGVFGLPAPALLLAPWVFDVHFACDRAGFARVPTGRWAEVGDIDRGLVIDLHHPRSALLLRAADPAAVDAAALQALDSAARDRSGVSWMLPLGIAPQAAGAGAALDAAHARGAIWIVTGDVRAWWAAVAGGGERALAGIDTATVLGPRCWAARVPLLVQPDQDGVGTRPLA